ncbi:MAG: hypothetical protein CL843_11070 [Crocinitomicaceae bacterium]|nr:hypothetical protein [Crocinitomicaceae bacterium]|tara:strand:+ start:169 stop:780 length:612 start_codon:yes stop_codon:yes gene_type:complete
MKSFCCILVLAIGTLYTSAQTVNNGTFWKPLPPNYEVKHAVEAESLFPMFLYGGFHFGVGYRYKKLRVRFSIINGGNYNVDGQASDGGTAGFERYYTTSPGYFIGYNVWKNLELYGYYESHTFQIKHKASGATKELFSNDFGIGLSYQFFFGRGFYLQPGVHTYFRKEASLDFSNGDQYTIPTFELTPVVRVGYRFFKRFGAE